MRLQLFGIGAVPAFSRGLTDSGAGNGEFPPGHYSASSMVRRSDRRTRQQPLPPPFGSMPGAGCDGEVASLWGRL